MIVVVAGVSGTGKSTIGEALSTALAIPFFDADDYHPQKNIDKMQRGDALDDDDRWPWLARLAELLSNQEKQDGAVLACSALKERYRERLSGTLSTPVTWIVLTGSAALLSSRLSNRKGHFFDARLLENQLATLEMPAYGLHIDVDAPIDAVVSQAVSYIQQVNH